MEWKILKGTTTIIQQTLNTWRHTYKLSIHGITFDNNNNIVIVLTRERIVE